MIGMQCPRWYQAIKDKPWIMIAGIFFFNSIVQQLVSTGAFEVFYDGNHSVKLFMLISVQN